MTFTSSKAAERLGVTVKTLQRWDREGRLKPSSRTKTNRRVYTETDLDEFLQIGQSGQLTEERREEEILLFKESIRTDIQPRYKFTRACLVLDTGLGYLKEALESKRFSVITRKEGSVADLIEALPLHILVTNTYKLYYYEAPVQCYSLIDTAKAGNDPQKIASSISNAFLDHELMQKQPFLLHLTEHGKVKLHLID